MAKLVALYTVVVNVLANAGLMVSDETAKQIRQVCTWANVKFTFPKLEDAVMDFYMLSLKYYRLLHERGTHTTDDWLARNMVKAFRQNRDENKICGVIYLLEEYVQKETTAFLNGSQTSIDFTLEPKDKFIGAINSWIRDGFVTANGEALRSRLVKLFNLGANQIIMHVSKEGMAESFRLVSTSEQDIDESIPMPEMSDAEYNASDIECNVTDASQATATQVLENKKGGVNPNLVSTLEGITGNKIERVQDKKEEKVMKFEDVKITAMDLLAVVSKNKQLRIAAGEKKPVAISTEEAMAMLRNPDSQFDVYRNYVLAFHQNTPKAQKNYGDIPKGAACSAASCFEAQKKQKKYKIHDIVVKTTKMKDGKPEETQVPMEMYLEEGTPTPQGFVAFKGKTDPVFKFTWGLDPKYGNLYYATPYVQHRPLMRDNNDNVIRDSLGRPVRQKWQRVDKKEDKLGIIKLIQDKLVELGFGNNGGIPGTEITLWG